MREVLIRLLAIQALAGLVVAAGFYMRLGGAAALASAYGVLIGLFVSILLALRLNQASRPGADIYGLLIGAAERMVFVGASFALGIAVFKLVPLAIVVGFGAAQLAYFIAAGPLKRRVVETTGRQTNGE